MNTEKKIEIKIFNSSTFFVNYEFKKLQFNRTCFIYIKKGSLKISLNDKSFNIQEKQLLLISKNERITHIEALNDIEGCLVSTPNLLDSKYCFTFKFINETTISDFRYVNISNSHIIDSIIVKLSLLKDELSIIFCNTIQSEFLFNLFYSIEDTTRNFSHIVKSFFFLLNFNHMSWHFVSDYSKEIGISPNHLNKLIKTHTKQSASFWIKEKLINEAVYLFINSQHNISQISDQLGFSEPSHFSKLFKNYTGMSPKNFIEKSLIKGNILW